MGWALPTELRPLSVLGAGGVREQAWAMNDALQGMAGGGFRKGPVGLHPHPRVTLHTCLLEVVHLAFKEHPESGWASGFLCLWQV